MINFNVILHVIFIKLVLFFNVSVSTKLAGGICLTKNIFYPINVMAFNHMPDHYFTIDFEVFGIVQGVFFRKHTEKQAKCLSLTGWCRNTEDGTVKGTIEGEKQNIKRMKHWLEKIGSPWSRIDNVIFSDIISIPELQFKEFRIIN